MAQLSPIPSRRRCTPLLALCTLLLAGCTNNPYPPGETGRSILYLAMSDDPKSLDPSVVYNGVGVVIAAILYPAYYEYDYLKQGPYALQLALGAAEPRRRPFVYTAVENGRRVRKRGE